MNQMPADGGASNIGDIFGAVEVEETAEFVDANGTGRLDGEGAPKGICIKMKMFEQGPGVEVFSGVSAAAGSVDEAGLLKEIVETAAEGVFIGVIGEGKGDMSPGRSEGRSRLKELNVMQGNIAGQVGLKIIFEIGGAKGGVGFDDKQFGEAGDTDAAGQGQGEPGVRIEALGEAQRGMGAKQGALPESEDIAMGEEAGIAEDAEPKGAGQRLNVGVIRHGQSSDSY